MTALIFYYVTWLGLAGLPHVLQGFDATCYVVRTFYLGNTFLRSSIRANSAMPSLIISTLGWPKQRRT